MVQSGHHRSGIGNRDCLAGSLPGREARFSALGLYRAFQISILPLQRRMARRAVPEFSLQFGHSRIVMIAALPYLANSELDEAFI